MCTNAHFFLVQWFVLLFPRRSGHILLCKKANEIKTYLDTLIARCVIVCWRIIFFVFPSARPPAGPHFHLKHTNPVGWGEWGRFIFPINLYENACSVHLAFVHVSRTWKIALQITVHVEIQNFRYSLGKTELKGVFGKENNWVRIPQKHPSPILTIF